jgi:hypothetical protein
LGSDRTVELEGEEAGSVRKQRVEAAISEERGNGDEDREIFFSGY